MNSASSSILFFKEPIRQRFFCWYVANNKHYSSLSRLQIIRKDHFCYHDNIRNYDNDHTQQEHRRYLGHTVRVIITSNDGVNGKAYYGDVMEVKAGYARNYLLPQKKAVYATRQKFLQYDIIDPLLVTESSSSALSQLQPKQSSFPTDDQQDEDLKAADLLKYYLRNKVLKIWRNVPDPSNDMIRPGYVDTKMVRDKLSKQLKIDLHDDEMIQFMNTVPLNTLLRNSNASKDGMSNEDLLEHMISLEQATTSDPDSSTTTTDDSVASSMMVNNKPQAQQQRIRQLGEYLLRISLRGGYAVPLKLEVLKR